MAQPAPRLAAHSVALFAAGGFEPESVLTWTRSLEDAHTILRSVESALHRVDQSIRGTALNKLMLCCALIEAEQALTLLSTLQAPGRIFKNLLRDWLDTKVSEAVRISWIHDLQRISSLITTLGDRIFWQTFGLTPACCLRSFDQLIELDSRHDLIRQHCLAAAPSREASIPLREQFFRNVLSEVRTAAQTKDYVTSQLQPTITKMQEEANAQQQQQQQQLAQQQQQRQHPPAASLAPTKRSSMRQQPQTQLTVFQTTRGKRHGPASAEVAAPASSSASASASAASSSSRCSSCRRNSSQPTLQCSSCSQQYHERCIRKHINSSFQQGRPFTCGLNGCELQSSDSSDEEEEPDSKRAKRSEEDHISSLFLAAAAVSTHAVAVSARERRSRRKLKEENSKEENPSQHVAPPAVARVEEPAEVELLPLRAEVSTLLDALLLQKQDLSHGQPSSSFMKLLSLDAPLLHPVIFAPKVIVALDSHEVVLIRPCRQDTLSIQQALGKTVGNHKPTDQVWLMHFGCVSDGGKQVLHCAKSYNNSDDGEYNSVPSERQLLEHIERDWAAASTPALDSDAMDLEPAASEESKSSSSAPILSTGQRVDPPSRMRNRPYFKDVSETATGFFPKLEKNLQEYSQPFAPFKTKRSIVGTDQAWSKVLDAEFHAHRKHLREHWRQIREHAQKRKQAETPLALTPEYFIHPLFLNELQLHRRSLAYLGSVDFDGVMTYYLYCKDGFQFFNLHIEQMIFPFIHHQLEGESLWFIIPHGELDKLYELAAEMYRVLYRVTPESLELSQDEFERHCLIMGRALLYSKQLWPPPSLLRKYDIHHRVVLLSKDDILTADGDCAHFGFSTRPGQTISVASNMATERWLKRGLPFLIAYFAWIGELNKILAQHEAAWRKLPPCQPSSIHKLKSPSEFAAKALNQCPSNFACSFARGLYADMDAMENNEEPVCQYEPKPTSEELSLYKAHCSSVVAAIHERRDFIKQMDIAACKPCTSERISSLPHTCMLCLCQGAHRERMLVDVR